jgi:hypothetical protein
MGALLILQIIAQTKGACDVILKESNIDLKKSRLNDWGCLFGIILAWQSWLKLDQLTIAQLEHMSIS